MKLDKITFIRPNMGDFRATDAMEPLVFAILAARTPKHIQIAFYDERLESLPLEEDTDLIAITVETFTARRAYQIADHYRARGIPVVMGGYHPTLLPQECSQHADAIVCGDAEELWEKLLQDLQQDRLNAVYRQTITNPNTNPDTKPNTRQHTGSITGPLPDRSIFQGKKYAPISLIQYGRGCRFNCDFCSIHAFYGHRVSQRPIDDVVAEISALKTKRVLFVDDNLFSNVQNAQSLCDALRPLGISWVCQVSVDITRHDKLLKLMKQSGCFLALIGFESLNEKNLKQMQKKWSIKRDYSQAIQRLHRHGIMVYGTFIFGYDYDDYHSFDTTLKFALQNKFFLANFNPLTPTPGTVLYDRLNQENKLLYQQWWNDPNYRYGQSIVKPEKMSAEQLTNGCLEIRRKFYQSSSILMRSINRPLPFYLPANLGSYLLANFISRREILNKQNQALGFTGQSSNTEEVIQ